MSVIFNLSKYVCVPILLEWLGLEELMKLDSALSSRLNRALFLGWLRDYAKQVNRLGCLRSPFIHIHRLNLILWSCNRTGRELKNESLVVIQHTLLALKREPNTNLGEIVKRFSVVRFDDVVKRRLEEDQLVQLLGLLGHVKEMHCISCPDNFFHLLKSFDMSSLLKLTISVNDYDYHGAVDVVISQAVNLKFLNIGIKDRSGHHYRSIPLFIVTNAVVNCRKLECFSITSVYPTDRRALTMLYLHRPSRLRSVVLKVEQLGEEQRGNGEAMVLERLMAFHQG